MGIHATIFNIMHYSVHDGPGIRTTVFFKGCPLSCKWCHNPESLEIKPQEVFYQNKCIKCGRCAARGKGDNSLDDNCPTGARETIGYEISIPELMSEIRKDLLFFEQSKGGVTFSGGEPLLQAEFLLEILAQCREDYINTAIDTSGYCDTGSLLKAAGLVNYILYDIKFIDNKKHVKYCGAPNELILRNFKSLANRTETKARFLIRIPVIPGINDDLEEMTEIFNFIKEIKTIESVHLLPYHNIQSDKYKRLGKEYELRHEDGSGISNDESPNMDAIKSLFSKKFPTKIGG